MELSTNQKSHRAAMQAIAESVSNTPMVLKGGTALLLCYGLDRFSEDLDFDCPKKINLESRIKTALLSTVIVPKVALLKDGENVTRYRLTGNTGNSPLSIKIETSHRDKINPDEVAAINGIRVYKMPVLARMKLTAMAQRTACRDLYDVHFMASKGISSFASDDLQRLKGFTASPNDLLSRYEASFKEDPLLSHVDPEKLILELVEIVNGFNADGGDGGRPPQHGFGGAGGSGVAPQPPPVKKPEGR